MTCPVVTGVALQTQGVHLVGLAATSTVLTDMVGLAAHETLQDLLGGLTLQISSPLDVGDWIALDQQAGRVVSITPINSSLRTLERAKVVFANSQAAAAVVKRFSRLESVGQRFCIGLDDEHRPAKVRKLYLKALHNHPGALEEPKP